MLKESGLSQTSYITPGKELTFSHPNFEVNRLYFIIGLLCINDHQILTGFPKS